MYDPNNPFAKFNTSPMSLLNVGGFQNPLQPQPIQQNFVNPQAVQQDVQNLEAQEKLKKRQRGALLLGALSDVLRGQDPTSGVLQKRQFFQQQEEERQAKLQEQQLQQQTKDYLESIPEGTFKNLAKTYLSQPDGYKYLPQLADLQMKREQQEQGVTNYLGQIDLLVEQGKIKEDLVPYLKTLSPVSGQKAINEIVFASPDQQTAAIENFKFMQKVREKGDPEEIELAEKIIAGKNQGKSSERIKSEVVQSLITKTDQFGKLISEEEIQQRLSTLDSLLGSAPINNTSDQKSSYSIGGYEVSLPSGD